MQRVKELIAGNKGFLFFVLAMIVVRSAVADWYGVPSGSMYPTLLIGDRIISDRLAYDIKIPFTDVIVAHLDDPRRGDIVTFTSPEDGLRLVKRVIGVPGDVIEMRGEELIINGERASYAPAQGTVARRLMPDYSGRQIVMMESLPGMQHPIIVMPERMAARTFGPVKVPAGEYLMLGDNRDASKDSRYIGFVPRRLITGRVSRVAFSLDTDHFYMPRPGRFAFALQ